MASNNNLPQAQNDLGDMTINGLKQVVVGLIRRVDQLENALNDRNNPQPISPGNC